MADYRRDLAELDARTRAVALRMLIDALPAPVESAESEPPVSAVVRRPTLLGVPAPASLPSSPAVLKAMALGPRPRGRY